MGVLFILFAVAMAAATFIENDFGSSAAYSNVYNTIWFELILLLLAVNLVGRVIILKLYRKDKLPVFLFHLSFVVMIIGAGITRYFGWEGTIHIREGEDQNICFSTDKYIGYSVKDANGTLIAGQSKKYSMSSVSADNFKRKIKSDGKDYELILARIIPNAMETISESVIGGEPVISFMVTRDMSSVETIILKKGDSKTAMGFSIGFESDKQTDVTVRADSSSFYISSVMPISETSMMHGESKPPESGDQIKLKTMQIIAVGDIKIVPQQMSISGTLKTVSVDPAEKNTGQNAFIFHVFRDKESGTVILWDKSSDKISSGSCIVDGKTFEITYGSKITTLPF